jgi:hypothetical protein
MTRGEITEQEAVTPWLEAGLGSKRLLRSAWKNVESHLAGGFADARAARVSVARRSLGRCLAPLVVAAPAGAHLGTVRRALGVVASHMLRSGMATQMLSAGFLARELGVSQRTAARVLRVLHDLGWIAPVKRMSTGVPVVRIPRLRTTAGVAIAEQHRDVIDALADIREGEVVDDLAGQLLQFAAHTAWSALPASAWTVCLARASQAAGDPASLLDVQRAPAVPVQLRAAMRGEELLVDALHRIAVDAGAYDAKKAAIAAAAQATEKQAAVRAELAEGKRIRAAARRWLTARVYVAGGTGAAPGAEEGADAVRAWARAVRAELAAGRGPDAPFLAALAYILERDIESAAWSTKQAAAIAAAITAPIPGGTPK